MEYMKTSFIATVLNEEKTIGLLLKSLNSQTQQVDEIIIVDGGSTDATVSVISNSAKQNKKLKIKLIVKKGNRAVGRNEAIKKATGDIILCSDAGCILDKDWVKNIVKPFIDKKADVVAGYYKGKASTIFEKSLIPYVLVMEDKINAKNFLPATRSMAFRKSVWEKIGGFPEKYSYNEDYVFAKKLKKEGFKIVFNKNAIVYWIPRKNIIEAFKMFFNFAYGDAQARIMRPKVVLIFIRYIIAIGLLLANQYQFLFFLVVLYLLWSIIKNLRYVKHWQGIFTLPLLQLTSDIAVIAGTIKGLVQY